MTTKKVYLGVYVSPQIKEAIDDFFYTNRYRSKAVATEFILRAGMEALKDEYPELDLNTKLETGKKENFLQLIKEEKSV